MNIPNVNIVNLYLITKDGFFTQTCGNLAEAFDKGCLFGQDCDVAICKKEFYPNWLNLGLEEIKTGFITSAFYVVKKEGKNTFDMLGNELPGLCILKQGPVSENIFDFMIYTNIISDKEYMFKNIWHIETIKRIVRIMKKNYELGVLPPNPTDDFLFSLSFIELEKYEKRIDELIKSGFLKDCSIFD